MPSVRLLIALLGIPVVVAADITPANVATLVQKWDVPGAGVTGGAIVRDGRVYVGDWSSKVKALDAKTGEQIWSRQVGGAVPGRVLALDDGGVCYGTLGLSGGEVGCLDGATGAVRWQKNVGDPLDGVVWSSPTAFNGTLYVGVAGLADNPCSRGRLIALDLADGGEKWRVYTAPEKVCTTDTSVVCTLDAECPDGGTCIVGRGAGVTAQPTVDPTGQWVYMNTVGCYTFPSIGDSDSAFKIATATGDVEWKTRVNQPEQFGYCAADSSIDCGTDGHCSGVGGTCTEKAFYHDFGFVNGPLRIEVPDGGGGTKTLIVSGSKNGTLYAFDEATGDVAWSNEVRTQPVSPNFAGFGLFNGAIAYADGRIYAALNVLAPARVCSDDGSKQCDEDADCPGATCPPESKHLMAFDATTGQTVWAEEIGRSWSHVGVVNGVVYAGRNEQESSDPSSLFAHDAATGVRLATFPLPRQSTARSVVVGDTLYVGYGTGAQGGVLAMSLCGNGTVDAGEACDAGPAGGGCCTAACALQPADTTCDDTDGCTSQDRCDAAGTCAGRIGTLDDLGCAVDKLQAAPCGDATLPAPLAKALAKTVTRIEKLFEKAAGLAAKGKGARADKLRTQALKALDAIGKKAGKAASAKKASKRISAECKTSLDGLVASRRAILQGYSF
jgi:outer membrane protein assembly factor BamB